MAAPASASRRDGEKPEKPQCPIDSELGLAPTKSFIAPNGGLQAYLQVLACLLINCMVWGYPATFGVFQLYYREALQLPLAQISWIGSVQVFLTFALCSFSGRLADAGYVRLAIAFGAAMTVLGTIFTSLATEYWQIFLAQGLMTGIGLGSQFMPAVTVVTSYFTTKKSFALAVAATGTGFGSIIFPCVIQYLIPRIGFGWAVRCQAFIALFMAIAALLLLRPQLKPRKAGPMVEWAAFKEPPYVLFATGGFLFFWALYFGFFYINTYARNIIGFSDLESVQLLLILNGLGIPARPIVGFVADRVTGPLNLFIGAALVLSTMIFGWIGVTTRVGMYVFAVFFGLSNGAAQGVFVGALASMTSDPRKMGTRFGMVISIGGLATLAGPPTAGAIIDRCDGKYLYAQIWGGLVIALAALTVAAARCWKSGLIWKVKI